MVVKQRWGIENSTHSTSGTTKSWFYYQRQQCEMVDLRRFLLNAFRNAHCGSLFDFLSLTPCGSCRRTFSIETSCFGCLNCLGSVDSHSSIYLYIYIYTSLSVCLFVHWCFPIGFVLEPSSQKQQSPRAALPLSGLLKCFLCALSWCGDHDSWSSKPHVCDR